MSQLNVKRIGWKKCLQWVGCLFFPLFAVIIMSEGLLGSIRQVWAYSYSETVGTITRSQLKRDEDSHLIDVEYSYEVLGKQYQGNQYCYGAIGTNTSVWDAIQQSLPVGLEVPVYYQSDKPEEAVLVRGLLGFHYGLLWFLAVFILMGPFIWHWMMNHRPEFDPADERLIAPSAYGWEYRPNGRNWWRYYLAGMMAICFAGGFIFFPHNQPVMVLGIAVVVLFLVPSLIAWRVASQVAVRADQGNRSWALYSRQKWITIPIGAIHEISVQQQIQKNETGPDEPTNYFRVVIEWFDVNEEVHQTRLDRWYGAIEVLQVAAWLKQQATAIAPMI